MTPVVSIVMPVFNGMPYVRQAVDSVLAQTLQCWQCVIVNDGSTDETPDFLVTLDDDRFVVVNQANAGIAAAVNRGLHDCRGAYIARLDADDVALPTRLAEQRAFLDQRPEVALVGTQVAPLGTRRAGASLNLPVGHEAIMSALMAGRHAVAHSSIMMRAEVLRQVGGYWSLPFGEEYDLMLRIGEVARLANLDRVLLHYRVHQASMNGSSMRRMRTSVAYACELARRRSEELPPMTFDEFQAQLGARPWLWRFADRVDVYARSQYRLAAAEIYGDRPARGYARMLWAAACQPKLTLQRVGRTVARRLDPRTVGESRS